MIYNIDEVRFYEIKNIKEVISYDFMLSFNNKNDRIASYLLEVDLTYLDTNETERIVRIKLPVELNTSDLEKMEVLIKSLSVDVQNEGVNLTFELSVELEDEIIIDDKALERVIEPVVESVKEEVINKKQPTLFDFIEESYGCYKLININMENIELISLKYNIPMEKLIIAKNSGSKVIVYER